LCEQSSLLVIEVPLPSLLSSSPNIIARSSGREFFPCTRELLYLAHRRSPASYHTQLFVIIAWSCDRLNVCRVSHILGPRRCVVRLRTVCDSNRRFSCSVLARFSARQHALSARLTLIPISSSTLPRLSSSVVLVAVSCPSSSLRRSQSSR
jgi:hypothetical protein